MAPHAVDSQLGGKAQGGVVATGHMPAPHAVDIQLGRKAQGGVAARWHVLEVAPHSNARRCTEDGVEPKVAPHSMEVVAPHAVVI